MAKSLPTSEDQNLLI